MYDGYACYLFKLSSISLTNMRGYACYQCDGSDSELVERCATCEGALGESRGVVMLDHGARLHNKCFVLFAAWYETRCNLLYVLRRWRRRAIFCADRGRLVCGVCRKTGSIFATRLLRLQIDARFLKTCCATCLASSVAIAKRYLQLWQRQALLLRSVRHVWTLWNDYVREHSAREDFCTICLSNVSVSTQCERLACGHNYHLECWMMYAASLYSHEPPLPLICAVCRADC